MRNKCWLAFILAVLLGAVWQCGGGGRISFYPGSPRFAPTDPDQVEIFRHEPRMAHLRFAEIRMEVPLRMPRREVEWRLRRDGAEIGAHALVIIVDNAYRESIVHGFRRPHVHRYGERDIVCVAIRFERRD